MSGLLAPLVELLKLRRGEVKSQFNRSLPFGDYISDRWEKAQHAGFGKGASVYDSAHIFGDVKVGENTWIGPFTILDGSGGLSIGSNCSISAGVQIYSHDSVDWAISGGKAKYHYAATRIGDNCYLGPNVIIAAGVVVGDGAVIGANSFVKDNVPAGARVAGNPAKMIVKSSAPEKN